MKSKIIKSKTFLVKHLLCNRWVSNQSYLSTCSCPGPWKRMPWPPSKSLNFLLFLRMLPFARFERFTKKKINTKLFTEMTNYDCVASRWLSTTILYMQLVGGGGGGSCCSQPQPTKEWTSMHLCITKHFWANWVYH